MKRLASTHPAVRETAVYGVATLLSQAIAAFRGFLIAAMLGPASYGLWKSVQVAFDWLSYTHLGVLHGMARQIPAFRKAGQEGEVAACRRVGFRAAVATALAAGAILAGVTWGMESVPWGVWVGIALLLVPTQLFKHLHMICLAEGRFLVLGGANLVLAVASLALMGVLVPRYGIYGVLWGLGGGYLAALAVGAFRSVFRSDQTPEGANLWLLSKRLAASGFPFMAVDGLFVVWQRLDRFVLIPFLGAESAALGCYGLATMAASFAIQIPQVFTRVLFRRTVSAFEEGGAPSLAPDLVRGRHLEIPLLAVATTSPLFLSLGVLVSWALVGAFLPAYSSLVPSNTVGAEESIALLLLACHGCGAGLAFRNIYTATDRQWRLAGIYAAVCTITAILPLLVFASRDVVAPSDIRWAGWGMAAASLVYGVLTAVDCHRTNGSSWGETQRAAATVALPFAVFLGWTLWALKILSGDAITTVEWIRLSLLAVALHLPIAVYGFWRIRGRLRNAVPESGSSIEN